MLLLASGALHIQEAFLLATQRTSIVSVRAFFGRVTGLVRQLAVAVLWTTAIVMHLVANLATVRHQCVAAVEDQVFLGQEQVADLLEHARGLAVEGGQQFLEDSSVHFHDLFGGAESFDLCIAHLLLVEHVHVLAEAL